MINIQEYIQELQKLADKYPKARIMYASDDEGNDYHPVNFNPACGFINKDGEFVNSDGKQVDTICVN